MPLSEREQRMLAQMEQALYAEDPQFANRLHKQSSRGPSRRRLAIGVIGMVSGLALVILGAMNALIWLGAIGFALMVAGGVFAFTPAKTAAVLGSVDDGGAIRSRGARGAKTQRGPSSFMQRLEQRWERRRDERWQ